MRGRVIYNNLTLLVATIFILIIGCSENLTNDQAKKIILATTKYPVKKIGSVEISQNPNQGLLITKDKMPNYIKMLANKLISMDILGIGTNGSEYYDVKLTDEGKKYVLKENTIANKLVVDVMLGEVIFEKIINIRKGADGEGYDVKYLEEMGRITPFGTCLIDKAEYERTVRLVLHDGKWKIK